MIFETTLRVRFRDTDMYGHVNNATYATYVEETRVAFLLEVFGEFTVPLIVASAAYQYTYQTRFPEHRDIVAKMWFSSIGNSSAEIATELLAQDGTLLCKSQVTIVYFDYQAQRPARIPEDVRSVLHRYTMDSPE
ncbi:acyl-CoA thioesterase [Alicyclobacillus fodiniaquatilis]|uniref:Acyl-CoA thioesterase n=1 Tax=Alicyclobacillus fodiniaquatilis TaxID=1661150 RepID=A0ABW4JMV1_9BACL